MGFIHQAIIKPLLNYLALTLCLLGLVFLWLGYHFQENLTEWTVHAVQLSKLFYAAGGAILGGGVFAVIMKSAQFTELFQQHIFEVINDPAKIIDKEDMRRKWQTLSTSMLKNVLPQYSDKAAELLMNKFLKSELEYHFEDFEATYDLHVEDDGDIINITNKMRSKLLISPVSDKPTLVQTITTASDDGSSELLQLLINNHDQLNNADFSQVTDMEGKKELRLELNQFCHDGSARSVNFERVLQTKQNLRQEPYIVATISRYIRGGIIKAKLHTNGYRLYLKKTGGNGTMSKMTQDPDGYYRLNLAASNELLLPGQGYIIMILPS